MHNDQIKRLGSSTSLLERGNSERSAAQQIRIGIARFGMKDTGDVQEQYRHSWAVRIGGNSQLPVAMWHIGYVSMLKPAQPVLA